MFLRLLWFHFDLKKMSNLFTIIIRQIFLCLLKILLHLELKQCLIKNIFTHTIALILGLRDLNLEFVAHDVKKCIPFFLEWRLFLIGSNTTWKTTYSITFTLMYDVRLKTETKSNSNECENGFCFQKGKLMKNYLRVLHITGSYYEYWPYHIMGTFTIVEKTLEKTIRSIRLNC